MLSKIHVGITVIRLTIITIRRFTITIITIRREEMKMGMIKKVRVRARGWKHKELERRRGGGDRN